MKCENKNCKDYNITFDNYCGSKDHFDCDCVCSCFGNLGKNELLKKLELARNLISDLCRYPEDPKRRTWTMSIPARPDHDPDLVLSSIISTAIDYIEKGKD